MNLSIDNNMSVRDLILYSENRYDKEIERIIEDILNKNKRIVLLTGPSGSGKTTTAKRLVKGLKKRNKDAIYLSMDNWFRTKSEFEVPLTEDGKPDYESPLCVNIDLLNEHLCGLLEGISFNLPIYDFVNQKMNISDKVITAKENTIIVLEGLHALNDFVKIDRQYTYRLLVCPENIIYLDTVFTQNEIRLFRRITRDKLHRGRTLEETLDMFNVVSRGEKLYLLPTLNDLDFTLNSFLEYELFLHSSVLGKFDKLSILCDNGIKVEDIPVGSLMEEFYKK